MLAFTAALAVAASSAAEKPGLAYLLGRWELPSLGSWCFAYEFLTDGRAVEEGGFGDQTHAFTLGGGVLEIRRNNGELRRYRLRAPAFTDSSPPYSFALLTWTPGTPVPKLPDADQRADPLFRPKPPPPPEDLPT